MSTTARRRTAMVALVLSLFGGGAALAANNSLLSPTADGGLPGPILPDCIKTPCIPPPPD
jgi:hypothetical protein